MITKSREAFIFAISLISLFLFSAPGKCDPLITDRPDFTESAVTVGKGTIQIETGYTYSMEGEERYEAIGELLARIGIYPGLEFRLGINSYSTSTVNDISVSGFEDMYLGVKLELFQCGDDIPFKPQGALLAGTSIPTGATHFRSKNLQPDLKLAAAFEITESIALGSNIIYAYLDEGGKRYSESGGSLSIGISLSGKTACYAEWYGFISDKSVTDNTNFMNGGFTYLITDNHQLDIRAGTGLNGIDNDYYLGIGAAFRF